MDKWDIAATKAWAAILEKVRSLNEKGETLEAIAKRLGMKNRGSISLWMSGDRKAENTPFPKMLRYLDSLGLNFSDYLPEDRAKIFRPGREPEPVVGDDLQTIRVYDVAGAGPAVAISEVDPLFTVTAPPTYFRMSDYALQVDGHSMEPLIPHGSVVGVRTGTPFVANELYAARIPYEGLVIKRIAVDRESNKFIFKSENKDKENYPPFSLDISEAEGIIVGRVVWVMVGY